MKKLQVKLKNITLKSPLMTASGTSGHSNEIEILRNSEKSLSALGAFVTKTVTLESRLGNPEFRIVETRTGILNSIGLQNKGVQSFVKNELHSILNFNLPIFDNISANSIGEFSELASYLSDNNLSQVISGLEINVSCPNIKRGGVSFGTDPKQVELIVKNVKKEIDDKLLIITKLTPNVTDITLPARAAINGGTDALSMINTLRGMAIDINTGEPFLGGITGGLSGPAIKPVGVFMVYECFRKISECSKKEIPIIGIGGISTWRDVLEYIMAGATVVGIGTAWFVNPDIFKDIHTGLKNYVNEKQESLSSLIGITHKKKPKNK